MAKKNHPKTKQEEKRTCCNKRTIFLVVLGVSCLVCLLAGVGLAIGLTFAAAQISCGSAQNENEVRKYFNASLYNRITLSMPNIRESTVTIKPIPLSPLDPLIPPNNITFVIKTKVAGSQYVENFKQDWSGTNNRTRVISSAFTYSGSSSLLLGCPKYDVTVYVPADKIFTIVDFQSSETYVSFVVDSILTYKLSIESKIADIFVNNSDISVQELSVLQGNIRITNVNTEQSLDATTTAGDVSINNVIGPRRATIKASVGKININNIRMYNNTALLDTTASNSITIDKLSQGSLRANTDFGKVDVSVPTSFSGSVSLEGSTTTIQGFNTLTLGTNQSGRKIGTIPGSSSSTINLFSRTNTVTLTSYT